MANVTRIPPELATTLAAIIDSGSLDAAARTLSITPSAVSQRLKSLEQQLGHVLVVRGRPATATAAGERVVRLARQIALLEHEALAGLGLEGDARISIPLAVNADSMATWFLAPLARIAASREIDFDLHRDDQDFTARLLESGEVMAAVTSERTPVSGCTSSALGSLTYYAVAAPSFAERWFPHGVVDDELRRAPFIDFDRRDGLQGAWLAARGVDQIGIPRHYVPASHDFAQAVMLGLGWALLPGAQETDAVACGDLVALGGDRIRVPLYWQQWSLRSSVLDAIAAEVASEAARVLD